MGAVSAAGIGLGSLRSLLRSGGTAVAPVPALGGRPAAAAAFTPPPNAAMRRLDRSARLFATACEEAWADAGLQDCSLRLERCGMLEGSSLGPMADLLAEHRAATGRGERTRAGHLVRFMSGMGGATFAQRHRLSGPVYGLSAGSASAAFALAEAWLKLRLDLLDVAVVGGGECPLDVEVVDCFAAAGVLSPADALPPCRPFDRTRCGTVLGEGAGALVLERADHARRRGAMPRAVVSGIGTSCESYSAVSPDPSGAGVASAAGAALGGTDPRDLGWIKTHGTGTRLNDAAECRGLAAGLGSALTCCWLTSLKPALGHCLGASAAIETVVAVLALEDRMVPATLGTGEVDPELPRCSVATAVREDRRPAVLMLAESFGGRCAAAVLRRP
jgi:3-oxoacyl-[acyl-carrier-protein] synthase II